MKVQLLYRDKDLKQSKGLFGTDDLISDLELNTIFEAMANDDKKIREVVQAVLTDPAIDEETILYRQETLKDVIANHEVILKLYAIIKEAYELKRKTWSWFTDTQYLTSIFSSARELLQIYTETLGKLRKVADENITNFHSESLTRLFQEWEEELSDEYLDELRKELKLLQLKDGMIISAKLGNYNQGVNYCLRKKEDSGFKRHWRFAPTGQIAPQDDRGLEDLGRREDRALNEVANALAQSAGHLEGFFSQLENELAFYLGGYNLYEKLKDLGEPVCYPEVSAKREFDSLYDISLVLIKKEKVTGNDLDGEDKKLYLITGANQGGKSTFLRSIGQAQLMGQAGLFVAGTQNRLPLRNGIYTHFKKEEDEKMQSGKLDEELARINAIVDHLNKDSLILMNESFSSTNEREGSKIGYDLTKALKQQGVEIFAVSHLYTYVSCFLNDPGTMYLKAQRNQDGSRSFRIIPGKPETTAYGQDIYLRIFNNL